jgi:hypothetical protein
MRRAVNSIDLQSADNLKEAILNAIGGKKRKVLVFINPVGGQGHALQNWEIAR